MSRHNFFRLTSSLLDVKKKVIFKTNKSDSDFQRPTRPAKKQTKY